MCTKSYSNRFIFDSVIQKIKTWPLFGTHRIYLQYLRADLLVSTGRGDDAMSPVVTQTYTHQRASTTHAAAAVGLTADV